MRWPLQYNMGMQSKISLADDIHSDQCNLVQHYELSEYNMCVCK